MTNYYVYLVSSLPMPHFGARPPFSFLRFLEICQDKISQEDMDIIRLTTDAYTYQGSQPTLKKWQAFECALRNELVKIRASRKHLEPLKYLRGDAYIEPHIAQIAMTAHRAPSILEAERILDQGRWYMLGELSVGHYFDLDTLIIYALKLLILERWEKINSADKSLLLQEVLN